MLFLTTECSIGRAQGILPDEKRLQSVCEDALTTYAAGRNFGGLAVTAKLHGEIRSKQISDGGVHDWVCGYAEIPGKNLLYEFCGIKNPVHLADRLWKQTLRWDERTMIRGGFSNSYDQVSYDSEAETAGDSQDGIPPMSGMPYCDPYWLPLVTFGGLYKGNLRADAGEATLLLNSRIVGVFIGKSSKPVGVWQLFGETGTVAEIEFSGTENPLPERIVWRLANGRATIDNFKDLHVFGISRSEWGSIKSGQTQYPVPVKAEFVEFDSDSSPTAEVRAFVEWKTGSKISPPAQTAKEAFNFRQNGCDWLESLDMPDRRTSFAEAKANWEEKTRLSE
jgi:hypothetical protein